MHVVKIYDELFAKRGIEENKIQLAEAYYNIKNLEEYKTMMSNIRELFNTTLKDQADKIKRRQEEEVKESEDSEEPSGAEEEIVDDAEANDSAEASQNDDEVVDPDEEQEEEVEEEAEADEESEEIQYERKTVAITRASPEKQAETHEKLNYLQ